MNKEKTMSRTLLLGCASLLMLALIGSSLASPAAKHAATPPAPPAPHAVTALPAPPVPPGTPTTSYNVNGVVIKGVYGTVNIAVSEHGPVTLAMSGNKQVLDNIRVDTSGGQLRISEEHMGHVWNWHEWFNFKTREKRDRVILQITAPKGSSLDMDDFVGYFTVGDLNGPVKIGAAAANGTIGNVQSASIELAGSGKIEVGTVAQALKIEIAGSGTVNAGASAGASVEIAGSGDTHIGPVLGGLKVDIAGSGDVTVASVNGPTNIETAGAGSIKIDTGEANPLKVEMIGSGDFVFGGEAVDPTIEAMGSGNVTLKSYRGKLNTEGMTHVKIGSN
jgi:hypothetical protein